MALRSHVTTLIDKHLDQSLDPDQRTDLEKGIYNASLQEANRKGIRKHWENPDFAEIYKMIARRCLANLDPAAYVGNARLIERLQEGEFEPHKVAFMTARELYPEYWQPMAEEQMKRENTMLEGDKDGGCDMFKCKKCKKARVKYYELQTRASDEPMSIFVTCLNCGHNWREQ